MRRHMLIIIAIGILTVCTAGCSHDLAATDPASTLGLLAPPARGDGALTAALRDYMDSCEWIEVDFAYPTGPDSVVTVVPKGYPASRPVSIVVHRTAAGAATADRGTLWLPAPPRNASEQRAPNGCVVFRTRNLPAAGSTSVEIHLPVMPWHDTLGWDGRFTVYRLEDAAAGWSSGPDTSVDSARWPDEGSYGSLCLTLAARPDKDETNPVSDQVVDPDAAGNSI